MTDLDKLEELAKAATPGPWERSGTRSIESNTGDGSWTIVVDQLNDGVGAGVVESTDAEFIASANPAAVLALIAEHRAVLARIAKVEALHRRYGIFELEDSCPDISDEHREEHHHECADEVGEFYCDQMPVGAVCDECRTEDGERVDWPCATVRGVRGEE